MKSLHTCSLQKITNIHENRIKDVWKNDTKDCNPNIIYSIKFLFLKWEKLSVILISGDILLYNVKLNQLHKYLQAISGIVTILQSNVIAEYAGS